MSHTVLLEHGLELTAESLGLMESRDVHDDVSGHRRCLGIK